MKEKSGEKADRPEKNLKLKDEEMEATIEGANVNLLKSNHKLTAKLQHRNEALGIETKDEVYHYRDTKENYSKQDRNIRELEFRFKGNKKDFGSYAN